MAGYIIFATIAVLVLVSLHGVNASSIQFSFTAMNKTVQIDQNLFFNVSASFPSAVNYTIYLNSTAVYEGSIPAYYSGYFIVKYNVTDSMYGDYSSSARFSSVSSPVSSDFDTYIKPHPSFTFFNPSNVTSFFNDSARLNVSLLDDGNTPLDVTWSVPVISGIDFSLAYRQSFSMSPSQMYSIPMNLSLSGNFSKALNFTFDAKFDGVVIQKTYTTLLFSPTVNISFLNSSIKKLNPTTLIYTVSVDNKDNSPLPLTLEFVLSVNGSNFYYNKSYTLYPTDTTVSVRIPNSRVLSVSASFINQYDKPVDEVIYAYKAPYNGFAGFFSVFGYLIITGAVIGIIVFIHYNFNKKGRKRRIWKKH